MKYLLSLLLLTISLHAQTAAYPSSVVTDAQLGVAADNVVTALAGPIGATDTVISLLNATGIPNYGIMSLGGLGGELIQVCSVTGNVVTVGHATCPGLDGRGFAGTMAAAAPTGTAAVMYVNAYYQLALRVEMEAVEANAVNGTAAGTGDLCSTSTFSDPAVCGIDGHSILGITGPVWLTAGVPRAAVAGTDYVGTLPSGVVIGAGTATGTGVSTSTPLQYFRRNSGNTAYEFGALPTVSFPSGVVVGPSPTGVAASTPLTYFRLNAIGSTYEFGGLPYANAADYNFTPIAPGGTLTGGGSNTVTIPTGPGGVNGSDANHYLYVSGGTGTAEAVLITGGTCTPGTSNCTLIFTPANNHSGAFTLQSVMGGIPEALQSLATAYGYGTVACPAQTITAYGPAYFPQPLISNLSNSGGLGYRYRLSGSGASSTVITLASNFPTGALAVLAANYVSQNYATLGPEIDNLKIYATEPDSTSLSSYTHWPWLIYATNAPKTLIHDAQLFGWNGIDLLVTGRARVSDTILTTFHTGINDDGQADSVYFDHVQFYPTDTTNNQVTAMTTCANTSITGMTLGRSDDFRITNSFFLIPTALSFAFSSAVSGLTGTPQGSITGTNFDTCSAVNMSDGIVAFGSGTGASSQVGPWMTLSGGVANFQAFSGTMAQNSAPFINATFSNTSPSNGWGLEMLASNLINGGNQENDQPFITVADSGTSGVGVTLKGNMFSRIPSIAWTTPMISDLTTNASTQWDVSNNAAIDRAGNADTFINVAHDSQKFVRNNSLGQANVVLGFSCPCIGEYESSIVKFDYPIENLAFAPSAVASAGAIAIPQYSPPAGGNLYYYKQIKIGGTATISTITVPSGVTGMSLFVLATGAWSTTTGGNIATAMTATSGALYHFQFFNGSWYVTGAGAAGTGTVTSASTTINGSSSSSGIFGLSGCTVTSSGTCAITTNGSAHAPIVAEGSGAGPVATNAGQAGQPFLSGGGSADPGFGVGWGNQDTAMFADSAPGVLTLITNNMQNLNNLSFTLGAAGKWLLTGVYDFIYDPLDSGYLLQGQIRCGSTNSTTLAIYSSSAAVASRGTVALQMYYTTAGGDTCVSRANKSGGTGASEASTNSTFSAQWVGP